MGVHIPVRYCGCVGGIDGDRGSAGRRAAGGRSGGGHRQRRHRRRRARRQRSRGRRLGDRGNARSAGALHQDRRHRRSGPLRHPRSAEGQLRHLGARLWPRRLAEGEERARQAAQSDRGAGAERGGRREVLPGDLLVRDDEDPGGRGLRQQGRAGQRQDHRLSQRHEEQRLRRLPPARPAVDPHDSEVPHGRGQDATRTPGSVASSPARPART